MFENFLILVIAGSLLAGSIGLLVMYFRNRKHK